MSLISSFPSKLFTMKTQLVSLLALLPIALAAPVKRQVDTTQHCGQWDTATEGQYELFLDQWGISGAAGSQCSQVTSLSGSDIAWTTTWTWSGGNGVKTFSNIQLNTGVNVPLSSISSMPVSSPPFNPPSFANDVSNTSRRGTGHTTSQAALSQMSHMICSPQTQHPVPMSTRS